MNIDAKTYRLPDNKIFKDTYEKTLIILHFTAGSTVEGAFNGWMQQSIQIGTPYIIDTDGTIYQIFDDKFWAYNLGCTGPKAQNHKHDKRSVAIETVNMGPLKLIGDMLCSWPNNYKQKFCMLSETDRYVKATYRGFDYFAAFPEVQKVAIVELVKKISNDFNIPIVLPPAEKLTVFDMDFYDTWKGVASHQNMRSDKTDAGPAFPWELLENKEITNIT
jgi:N-acetyl-anhydromuramyl-L-alanine amidase AmpD